MAGGVNKAILIGNLGEDPEVRFTPGGQAVANFRIATSESWTDKLGQKQEKTEWHRVEVFGKAAQVVRDYVTKGKPLYVEGSIKYDEYTDKDGIKRNVTKIRVSGFNSRIVLLGSRGDSGPRATPSGDSPSSPADDFQASDEDVPF